MTNHHFGHFLFSALMIFISALPLIGSGIVIFLIGFLIFTKAGSPYETILGIPVILVGLSIILINLYEVLAGILDRRYNLRRCLLCRSKTEKVDGGL
ncbi:MAG: hypothetical protein M1575_00970 [Patescibacteria group bacterium]|nr:hypothetical protein [Patescibacteria group bacterium]MCL5095292.1 hypothetical protein [Patescibacteria group bacterium]